MLVPEQPRREFAGQGAVGRKNLLVSAADGDLRLRTGPITQPDTERVRVERQGLLGVLGGLGQLNVMIPFLAGAQGISDLLGRPDRRGPSVLALRLAAR